MLEQYLNRIQDNFDIDEDEEEWIGVDLDGTLAYYDGIYRGLNYIGQPIPKMVERIHDWLNEGINVKIFTARAHYGGEAINVIKDWLREHGLPDLEITNVKTPKTKEIWDDIAVRVERNTGEPTTI